MRTKILEIEWIDSTSYGRWQSNKKASDFPASRCKSVGYLVGRTRKETVLCLSRTDTGDQNDHMTIPNGCITRRRIVGWSK